MIAMENRPTTTTSNSTSTTSSSSSESIDATAQPPPPTTAAATTTTTTSKEDQLEVERRRQRRFSVLSYEQVKRLDAVMDQAVPIHGRGNFPTLDVKLKDLVAVVRARLEADGIKVRDIRVNGGAASHILAREGTRHTSSYNDLDLIFGVDLSSSRNFERVKTAVLESLLDFLPEGANRKRISACSLKEAYVRKMVKVTSGDLTGDRWSLITLGNNLNGGGGGGGPSGGPRSRNVELKFVDSMRRQFEFSVDSFQIVLDSLLVFYECATMPMADDFYPTVVGESVHGDFDESMQHLHEKLIATRNPEEIRGGGLLKYCHLLVRGYRAVCADRIKSLERYMCSRFFIDFSDLGQQQQKLENYLANHFGLFNDQDANDDENDDDDDVLSNCDPLDPFDNASEYGSDVDDESTKTTKTASTATTTTKRELPRSRRYLTYDYLMTLYRVVDESTVCLMSHERRQTLSLIEELACQVYFHEQQRMFQRHFERQQRRRLRTSPADHYPQLPQYGQHRMAPWTIYGNSTIYYTPYVPTTGHHHNNHHHHQHHHHQQQQQQQHYTLSWLPCV